MKGFILILTLSNAGTIYEGKAIHSIEFSGEPSCISAGEKWQKSLPKDDFKLSSFVCVPNFDSK